MDPQVIRELLISLRLELITYKEWCLGIFIVISSAALVIGSMWPQTYSTSAVLHADVTNIIEPLLKGRTVITKVDRSQAARDVVYTRKFAETIVKKSGLSDDSDSPERVEAKIAYLRAAVKIFAVGTDYFRISYSSSDPDIAYNVLSTTVNEFIEYTSRQKKDESYSAYKFIDSQVQAYKKQLEEAEARLKEFKSQNVDGTEASVSTRIAQLRNEIEALKLSIEENQSRVNTTKSQLSNESDYIQASTKLEGLQDRKKSLMANLEELRLIYQDNYPDIVTINAQIEEIDKNIASIYESDGLNASSSSKSANPLYDELRKQLSVAEVDLRAQNQRMNSLNRLLDQEYVRAQKVAENEASLSELTRDYNVTKGVYEEMLGRKESARLSMVLDIEGQGVTYRIHEPVVFPLSPSGINPIIIALLGPILGVIIPLCLVIAYILVDPRLRSYSTLEQMFSERINVIGSIPHASTAITKRILKRDAIFMLVVLVAFTSAYAFFIVQNFIGK